MCHGNQKKKTFQKCSIFNSSKLHFRRIFYRKISCFWFIASIVVILLDIGECKYRNSGIYKSGNNFFQIENKRFSLVVLSTLWQRLTNIYSKILKHLFSFFALFMELYMGGDWLWRSDLYVSSWKVNKGQLWLIFLLILRFCVKDTWSNSSIKTLEIVNLEGWSTKFKNYIFTSYNIGLNSHNKIWDLERI